MGSENDCVFVVVSILAELEVNGNSGLDSFWQVNNIFNSPPVLKSIENADHN